MITCLLPNDSQDRGKAVTENEQMNDLTCVFSVSEIDHSLFQNLCHCLKSIYHSVIYNTVPSIVLIQQTAAVIIFCCAPIHVCFYLRTENGSQIYICKCHTLWQPGLNGPQKRRSKWVGETTKHWSEIRDAVQSALASLSNDNNWPQK